MVSKYYKEIKVDSIYDIKVGDIVFFKNNAFGIVIKKGKTILHSHKFIIIKLKTLKDIGRNGFGVDGIELKEEAIKWYNRSDGNKHKFIMEFFNLSESDVSSEKSEW